MSKKLTLENEVYYQELDWIRDSGMCNMYGATPYLNEEFPELTEKECRKILTSWMEEYEEWIKYRNKQLTQ